MVRTVRAMSSSTINTRIEALRMGSYKVHFEVNQAKRDPRVTACYHLDHDGETYI